MMNETARRGSVMMYEGSTYSYLLLKSMYIIATARPAPRSGMYSPLSKLKRNTDTSRRIRTIERYHRGLVLDVESAPKITRKRPRNMDIREKFLCATVT